jgi:hypothetical protein
MKHIRALSTVVLAMTLSALVGTLGCESQPPAPKPRPNDSCLVVSGPPGTRFMADYRSAGRHDVVVPALSKKTPSLTIVEFREDDLVCEIRKIEPSSALTVSIYRDGRCLFLREAPAGVEGLRITHFWAGWKAEMY